MKHGIIMIIICALSFCTQPAQAVPIAIQITGEVTNFSDGTGLLNTIHVGSIFTGTYTYDSSTQDSDTNPQRGEYQHNSPYGIDLYLGGFEFKTDPAQTSGQFVIGIGDNVVGNGTNDYYSVHSYQNSLTNGLSVNNISWELRDSTHTALSSTALPVIAPVLIAWNYNYVEIYGGNSQHGFYLGGIVTQATPEPLTGVLMAMGVFFLRRRR